MLNILTQVLGFLLALILIFRLDVRRVIIWGLAGTLAILAFTNIALVYGDPLFAFDYRRNFWPVGRDVWGGINPYADDRFAEHPFLNMPTALPLFAIFALLPADVSTAIWTIANVIGICGLVVFSQRVLEGQEHIELNAATPRWKHPPFVLAGLTAVVAVSTASFTGLATGQLCILVTLGLLAAFDAQSRRQPIRAGLWLALASIKITTLFPFLLLFTRWADRRSWVSFAVGTAALTFIATPPTQLPERLSQMFYNVKELQQPGQVNAYTFSGTQHTTMLGLEHALYRIGLHDPAWIEAGQYVLLSAIAIAVACLVVPQGRMPRAAACSLVAAFSAIFLYHRIYDTVILVVPLVYCTGWARASQGWARRVFAGSALAILLVLYLPKELLIYLTDESLEGGPLGWLIQATILPYATWCVLLVMACIVVGARLVSTESHAARAPEARS